MQARSGGQIGVFVLVAAVLGGLLAALSLWNTVQLMRLAERPAPSLVQLASGEVVTVEAREAYHREPEVIRRFVADALAGLFTWKYTLGATNSQPETVDPGVVLSNRGRVSTAVYQASFYLAESLRPELLRQLAGLSGRMLSRRGSQVLFAPRYIGQPRPLAGRPHTWSVDVVGTQTVFSSERPEGEPLPFSKQVIVQAIEPPLGGAPAQTPLEQALHRIRAAGLEIVELRPLALQ